MKLVYNKNNPKQQEFIEAQDRYLLFLGGRGSGKSFGSCVKALKWALPKNNIRTLGMIVSPTYNELQAVMTILWDLMWNAEYSPQQKQELKPQAGQPLIVNKFNIKDRILTLANGSKILFRSGDDPDTLRGYNLDWALLDEASKMKKLVFDNINLCLRGSNEKARKELGQQLFLSTTPKGHNWVYEQDEINHLFRVVRSTTYDNKENLSEEYIEALENLSGGWKKQEIEAEYIQLTGLVYPQGSYSYLKVEDFLKTFGLERSSIGNNSKEIPENNSIEYRGDGVNGLGTGSWINHTSERKPKISTAIGIDVGYTHNSAIIFTVKIDKAVYVVSELVESELTTAELVSRLASGGHLDSWRWVILNLEQFSGKKYRTPLYIDSARPDVIEEFRKAGYFAKPAKKDVLEGISLIQNTPVYVNPSCENLIRELSMYSWGENDKPKKIFDDACDALRYAVMGLKSSGEVSFGEVSLYDSDKYYRAMKET